METRIEWNVYCYNTNKNSIEKFNIFNHRSFSNAIKELFSKKLKKEEFENRVRGELMYYFWSKSEYEILISDWTTEKTKVKVDIYNQIMMNWDRFIDYVFTFVKLS